MKRVALPVAFLLANAAFMVTVLPGTGAAPDWFIYALAILFVGAAVLVFKAPRL